MTFRCNFVDSNSPMRLGVLVKYVSTNFLIQADGFKNLGAAITLQCRDSHLRHDLQDAFGHCLDEIFTAVT
jgi:hypothetical protein